MKQVEKEEIKRLPSKYKPLGAWGYFGYNLLFAIPVIGQILLIIFCFVGSNVNRRSYARSFFCALLIAIIVLGIVAVLAFTVLKDFFAPYWEMIQEMMQSGVPAE